MINVELVKAVTGFVVSSGVSTMVGYAAKSSVPRYLPEFLPKAAGPAFHLWKKIAITAGAGALAGMAADQAVKYTDKEIDNGVIMYEKIKAKIDETVKTTAEKKSGSAGSDS